MGKVRTSEFYRIPGLYEPAEDVFDYVYCDRCGSFNIRIYFPKSPVRSAAAIVTAVSLAAAIPAGVLMHSWAVSVGIGVIGLISYLALNCGERMHCRTCGNESITSGNVLNFSAENLTVDVPAEAVVKKYVHTVIR